MQPKNLGWKFAGTGLLVALCAYAIWAYELRQGIDLKGGHILTFQVRTLGKEGEPGQETSQESVQRVISTLKERIDPSGLSETAWRPIGEGRFEVRMPMGTQAARDHKAAYELALRALEEKSVQPADIRRIGELSGPERQKKIDTLSAGDVRRKELLDQLAFAGDAYRAAQDKLDALRKGGNVDPKVWDDAVRGRDTLAINRDAAERAVLDTNVNREQLVNTLERFVSSRERTTLPREERLARDLEFRMGLEKLYEQQAQRKAEIDAVVLAYKRWTEARTGLDDPEDLKRLVARAGVLEYRIAPTLPVETADENRRRTMISQADYEDYLNRLADNGPRASQKPGDRYQWFMIHGIGQERFSPDVIVSKYAGKRYMLLYNNPENVMLQDGQWALKDAHVTTDSNTGRPAVGFTMDPRGARRMGDMTGRHLKNYMAILLDDELYSAPVIQSTIYADGQITGDFSRQEVRELVRTLKAGALDAQVDPNPVREVTIEASLGRDNREKGFRAAVYGLIATALFIGIFYLVPGMIANIALLLNLVLVLGAMCFIDAVFTLPGIAGVILTIGMAVDANVLIYERLREEQAKSQSVRMAIRNAYANAFSAIFDSNATTVITCLILGWVGTEEVRGFAITLGLGLVFSLFTSLVVTRWIFQLLIETGLLKGRIPMLPTIRVPKIDWMGKRRIFASISIVLIVVSLIAIIARGRDALGLEFSSGTQATFRLKPGSALTASVSGSEARGVIERAFTGETDRLAAAAREDLAKLPADSPDRPAVQRRADELKSLRETTKMETLVAADKAKDYLDKFDANGDHAIDPAEWQAGKADPATFKTFDTNGDGKLDRDEILAIPPHSFQVATQVAEPDLLREIVRNAFGAQLDTPTSVDFALKKDGRVEALGIDLAAADNGFTHISTDLANRTSPAVQDRFLNATGGVMFVIEKVSPALSAQELEKRLRDIRAQPDFVRNRFSRETVIGLTPDKGDTFTSFAVLVKDPEVDYARQAAMWRESAGRENELLTAALAREETFASVQKFDASVAGRTSQMAVVAFVLSWAAIVVYLWLRFGTIRWGLAAVICLIHDVTISVGMVAASAFIARTFLGPILMIEQPLRIDMTVVAAFLTIIGYSVNDTIVIFDRIRENRGRLHTVDAITINNSVNQTFSRTMLTTGTTLIAVLIMYIFGGEGIHPFTWALLVGMVVGVYSTVGIASPMLLGFKEAIARTVVVPVEMKG